MKRFGLWSSLFVSGILSIARSASADRIWIQQPGRAKEIAVASNDMPWIVDTNGQVEYGTPAGGCGNGICVQPGGVDWHVLGPGTAAHIAVGLDNVAYITDPVSGDIWIPIVAQLNEVGGLNGNNWFNYFSSAPWWEPNNWYDEATYYLDGTRA